MPFCSNCGAQLQEGVKFCNNCGAPMQPQQEAVQPAIPQNATPKEPEEIAYYKGEGELIIKRTEHRGAARKFMGVAAGLSTLGLGYVLIGKDKTRKSKAEGQLIVTNKAIYCAGNDYPFDRIISITKQGTISKSIVLTFEKEVQAGGRAEGGFMGIGGLSIEAELKTKDIDGLFKGLERAKLSGIKGL